MTEYFFPTAGTLGGGGSTSGTSVAGGSSVLDANPLADGASLGLDIACWPDLDDQFALIGGLRLLAQDLLNRLSTPTGGLFYDDSYGYDLTALLNASLDERDVPRIAGAVRAQCLLDERVADVAVTVTLYRGENRLTVGLAVETDEGPFAMQLAVTDVTVDLLEVR